MADRSRRMRRQISDVTDESLDVSDAEGEEVETRRPEAGRRAGRQEIPVSPASRAKRNAPAPPISPHAAVGSDGKQSIKLTMKVAPSKLREVMRANEVDSLKDTLGGGTVLDGPRSRRSATQIVTPTRVGARPKYIEPQESDLEDDEDEEDEDEGEEENDAEAEEDVTMNDFDEIGAEAEGGTDDEDVEMDDEALPVRKNQSPPKPPKITLKTPSKKNTKQPTKPTLVVTPAEVGPVLPVEDQEMEDDAGEDDAEDSEVPEDETGLNEFGEVIGEDAEGEDDELEDDDDELDDSDEEPGSGSATPDPSKLTSRQRGRPVEPLMALDMAPQQRKFFTDEEKAMKKDEHARKRKELTKRKVQEEKTAALNRLLKPQVSKSRGAAPKAETLAAQLQAAAEEEEVQEKADPLFTRWTSTKTGIKLGVPEEWLGKNIGRCFGPALPPSKGALVQEIE